MIWLILTVASAGQYKETVDFDLFNSWLSQVRCAFAVMVVDLATSIPAVYSPVHFIADRIEEIISFELYYVDHKFRFAYDYLFMLFQTFRKTVEVDQVIAVSSFNRQLHRHFIGHHNRSYIEIVGCDRRQYVYLAARCNDRSAAAQAVGC